MATKQAQLPSGVSDLMTEQVVTLRRDDTLVLADEFIRLGRIRHLPVVDAAGQLCGLISQRDLSRALLGTDGSRLAMKELPVEEVMEGLQRLAALKDAWEERWRPPADTSLGR